MPKLAIRTLAFAFLLLSAAAWPRESASVLQHDTAECRRHANIDACYNAVRWNPGDPMLLIALGDALVRANRPADALRNYRRAAEIAPSTRGIAAKINVAEAKLSSKHTSSTPAANRVAAIATTNRRYSNASPEAQSH
jgi:cytochrome c-type biogenesis protein CcmH/NrfG